MKKKITALFVAFSLAFMFYNNLSFFSVQGAELVKEKDSEQIIERTGYYQYDVASKTETFIPIEEEKSISSNNSSFLSTEGNASDYIPNGLSPDYPGEYSINAILGSWSKIDPATGGQYRNTVCLTINTDKGTFRGTGFMIGPNTVATCGHNVLNYEYGSKRWANSITVTPAKAGTSSPYGYATSTGFECGGNWGNSEDPNDDWGIIRLNKNIGDNVGWLGLRCQSASYNGTSITGNGYPGYVNNKWNEYMYRTNGSISSSYARLLRSKDTNADNGMSGGPIYYYSSTYGYQAIGFFRSQATSYNVFMRIDEWIFDKFMSFRNKRA